MKKILFGLLFALASAAALAKSAPQKYVYLFDFVEKQPYKTVWQKDIWQQVKKQPRGMNVKWVNRAQGASSPVKTVTVGGRKYYRATLCEPHNCPHILYVLFDRKKAVALRVADLDLYYGNPNPTEQDYLNRWQEAEQQGKDF